MKISQDKQFIPTVKNIGSLLAEYNLKLLDFSAADNGIENTTLVISAKDNQKYILRVYRRDKKSNDAIKTELDFMELLLQQGIPVPKVLKNSRGNNITLFEIDGYTWQAICMEYIIGVHSEKYTTDLITDLATTQAKMHNIADKFRPSSVAIDEIKILKEDYFISQIDIDSLESEDLKKFLLRAKKYTLVLDDTLPKGLCHLDYDTKNVLVKNGSIAAVLDFDDLALAPFVMCLGYTLWHVKRYAGNDVYELYLERYQSVRRLNQNEKTCLASIMLFRHYVISSLKILKGQTKEHDIISYIDLESDL